VFCIDADEYLSDELRSSILRVKASNNFDGYFNNRRNKIGDRWINHGSWYPDRKIRLFDRRKVKITGQDPHDVMAPEKDARIGYLKGDLLHLADENFESGVRKMKSTARLQKLVYNGITQSFRNM
jgi:hypothetical protein